MNMSKNNRGQDLPIIGATEWVDVGKYKRLPAKTDTGAASTSIWASHIRVEEDGTLKFRLFDKSSKYYTGKVFKRAPGQYKVGIARSSNGQEEIRYRVYLPITIAGKRVSALFYLSDRSKNTFPILIGRRTVAGKFLVNPAINYVTSIREVPKSADDASLNDELKRDPYAFHQKYVINRK